MHYLTHQQRQHNNFHAKIGNQWKKWKHNNFRAKNIVANQTWLLNFIFYSRIFCNHFTVDQKSGDDTDLASLGKLRSHLWTVKKHLHFFVGNCGLSPHASHILIGKNWSNCTVFENHRKSLIQHCERSELRLHFESTKVN